MILVLSIICVTIVICSIIRYSCIWACQMNEYKIYKELHATDIKPYTVRPYLYQSDKENFWGYIVYDTIKDEIYKGSGKANEHFIIYRLETKAAEFCKKVNELHGY